MLRRQRRFSGHPPSQIAHIICMKVWGQVPKFHAGRDCAGSFRGRCGATSENIYIVGTSGGRILRKRRSGRRSYIYSRQLPPRESLGPVPKLSSRHLPQAVDGHLDIERVKAWISKRHSMRNGGIVDLLVRLPPCRNVSIDRCNPSSTWLPPEAYPLPRIVNSRKELALPPRRRGGTFPSTTPERSSRRWSESQSRSSRRS